MRHTFTRAGITSLVIVLALLATAAGWAGGNPPVHRLAAAQGTARGWLPPRCDRIPADHNPALRAHRACRP
jgi:hypothetical protein